MSVYVDEVRVYLKKGKGFTEHWCHMMADTPEELHAMADKIGLARRWFQDKPRFPHYDLRPSKRILAVNFGAEEISAKEMVTRFSDIIKSGIP
jgi:hypothetical protein